MPGGFRAAIGAALPLARIVEAHRLAGSRHQVGNTVVPIGQAAA